MPTAIAPGQRNTSSRLAILSAVPLLWPAIASPTLTRTSATARTVIGTMTLRLASATRNDSTTVAPSRTETMSCSTALGVAMPWTANAAMIATSTRPKRLRRSALIRRTCSAVAVIDESSAAA